MQPNNIPIERLKELARDPACKCRMCAERAQIARELIEVREDRERLNWLFSLGDNGASVQQIEFLLVHTDGPIRCREEIDKFRAALDAWKVE